MLTKTDLRHMVDGNTYNRGRQIEQRNMVLDLQVDKMEYEDEIAACVQGQGSRDYDVYMRVDRASDRIMEYSCSCPAYYTYDGMCKHCVAVGLEYIAHQKYQMMMDDYFGDREDAKKKLQGIQKGMRRQTTPEIKDLLKSQSIVRVLPVIEKETFGRVRIEPILHCDRDSAELEFRIGSQQMYVLKDVFAFEDHIRNHQEFAYGKKLKFVHVMEAFEEDSRPIVDFICNWVSNNIDRYQNYSYYGYSSVPKLRQMPLHGIDIENFMLALGKRPVLANINNTGEIYWKKTEEKLPRELEIKGETDGATVTLKSIFGYECDKQYVYFKDEKIYLIPRESLEEVAGFLRCMAQIPARKVFIEQEDIPAFCRNLLPVLKKHFHCEIQEFDESRYGVVSAIYKVYLDAPERSLVTCRATAVYGDLEYSVYDRETDPQKRDLAGEMQFAQMISGYCNVYDEKKKQMVIADDEELLYELLTDGVDKLQEVAEVYISDALKRIEVMHAPKTSVGVSLSGELLELKLTSDDMPMDELVEILSRYDRKKKYYRLKNGDFLSMDEEGVQALLDLKQTLMLSDKQMKQGVVTVPKYRALYLDSELKDHPALHASKDKYFKMLIRNMKTIEDNDFELPDSLSAVLREYQKTGFLWIKTLCHNGFGGILADDMGLGKTLQVIAFLLSEQEEAENEKNLRTLVACPASLVYNWKSELERFAPAIPVKMVTGTVAERRQMIESASEKDVLLTSYDTLKRDISFYENVEFFCEIIDEAQYIKNHNTQAAQAVKLVHAGFRLALTGTPVENRLSELWSIFDYLMPDFLYHYQRFRSEIEIPMVQNGDEKATARLQKLIAPFVLRRLKKDVLKDLPDKLEENCYVQIEGEQQKLYDAHVKRMQLLLDKTSEEEFRTSKIQILAELTKLRQICCDPALLFEGYKGGSAKLDMCLNLIENAVENGHKILLFSQFTTMLSRIQGELDRIGISYYTLTGSTSKEKRMNMVEAFQTDDTKVFCISLKAGGTGLNLTAADIVIHYDPWWNLAVQDQATDRAHRIGQKHIVNVYKLLAKGTIEDNIQKLQEKKRELADKVLSGGDLSGAGFTKEELMEILGG